MGLLSPAEVGKRIREARDRLGLDQGELAERLGGNASQGLVSNWECGRASPSRANLILLAGALGVPVERLLVDDRPTKAVS